MNALLKTSAVAVSLAWAFAALPASAQVIADVQARGAYLGYPLYATYRHASTPAEGLLSGRARVIRSMGEYNLYTSQAMINVEEARSRYLDNELKTVETYFEKRRLNRTYRAAERGPRITAETAARLSQARQPDRLGSEELDRATGRIAWPAALLDEDFAPYRMRLETLFAMQTTDDSGINSASYLEISKIIDSMSEQLQQRVRDMAPQQYSMARSFLDRVEHEARFPLESDSAVASQAAPRYRMQDRWEVLEQQTLLAADR